MATMTFFVCPMVRQKKNERVRPKSLFVVGQLDVSQLLDTFEEELETASPFLEEHAERIALIRANVCGTSPD